MVANFYDSLAQPLADNRNDVSCGHLVVLSSGLLCMMSVSSVS